MTNNSHRKIQEKLINKMLLALALIAIPAVSFSLFRFTDIGWQSSFAIHIIIGLITIIFAILRKKISYQIKVNVIIGISFALSIAEALNLGLSGFFIEYLMLAVFGAVVFWSRKSAIIILILGSISIIIIGFLISQGVITQTTDLNEYTKLFSTWLATFSSFTFITALVILIVGEIGHLLSSKIVELQNSTKELNLATSEIQELQGILPICSNCKKVKDSKGYWKQVENYISANSDVKFSHSLCNSCVTELYGDQDWYKKSELKKKVDINAQ